MKPYSNCNRKSDAYFFYAHIYDKNEGVMAIFSEAPQVLLVQSQTMETIVFIVSSVAKTLSFGNALPDLMQVKVEMLLNKCRNILIFVLNL